MKLATVSSLAMALVLTACGTPKLEGAYSSDRPGIKGISLTLMPNGKAVYMGESEMAYEADGSDVKLHMPQGVLILKRRDDGSLDFPFLGTLKRIPDGQ